MSRTSLVGSTLVHVAAIWLLFFVVPPTRMKAMPQTIQVALVNLPAGAALPSRGTPAAPPAPAASEREAKSVREEPAAEKNAVRPPDAKKPVPSRPRPGLPEGVSLASAPLGVPGLSGDVAVSDANFEFTYYLIAVRNRISQNWGAPAGIVTSGNRIRCTVFFRIDRLGRLSDIRLTEPSGVAFFDESAQRAVRVSNPLPPLPAGYGESSLGVHFGFQYTDR